MSAPIEDCDRFLLFMGMFDPSTAEAMRQKSQEELVKVFAAITGWEPSRALSAFEVCVVKGFIDKQ